MTPMIDVVFNLIIFFMIVIDLSQQELEDITLPRASECTADDKPEDNRKIVNLRRDGTMVVRRQDHTLDTLRANLATWVQFLGPDGKDKMGFCEKPILIRTDRGTEMKHCQKVMQICGEAQLKIWKIELACSEDGGTGISTEEIPGVIVHD